MVRSKKEAKTEAAAAACIAPMLFGLPSLAPSPSCDLPRLCHRRLLPPLHQFALVAAVKAPASTPSPCPCPRLLLLSQLLLLLLLPPPRLPPAQPNVATLGKERGGRQRSTMDTSPDQSAASGGKGCSASSSSFKVAPREMRQAAPEPRVAAPAAS